MQPTTGGGGEGEGGGGLGPSMGNVLHSLMDETFRLRLPVPGTSARHDAHIHPHACHCVHAT